MTVRELHESAMRALDCALSLLAKGKPAGELLADAFRLEKLAVEALLASPHAKSEPTRSVLLRSAANLAIDCGLFREAEQLAALGLAGTPPEAIAGELRDTLDRINFARHLDLQGLTLSRNEVQASLHGNSVTHGLAAMEEVEDRMRALRVMTERIAERRDGREYRKGNAPKAMIKDSFRPYVSIARAASYAFTVHFGVSKQLPLEIEDSPVENVIDDLLKGLQLVDAGDDAGLESLIPDPAYRRNFTALAQQIAPDGERIKQVGFTVMRGDQEHRVTMLRATQQQAKPQDQEELSATKKAKVVGDPQFRVKGVLLDGLGSSEVIVIQTAEQQLIKIRVQDGLEDTVRSYFSRDVIAEGTMKGGSRILTKMTASR